VITDVPLPVPDTVCDPELEEVCVLDAVFVRVPVPVPVIVCVIVTD
jgi:hypothetical protein